MITNGHAWDDAFQQAFNTGDSAAIHDLFEADALWTTEPGQHVRGVGAIAEGVATYAAMGAKIQGTTKAVLDHGDLVVVYSDWTIDAAGEAGPIELAGNSTVVLRRQADGALRAVIDDPFSQG